MISQIKKYLNSIDINEYRIITHNLRLVTIHNQDCFEHFFSRYCVDFNAYGRYYKFMLPKKFSSKSLSRLIQHSLHNQFSFFDQALPLMGILPAAFPQASPHTSTESLQKFLEDGVLALEQENHCKVLDASHRWIFHEMTVQQPSNSKIYRNLSNEVILRVQGDATSTYVSGATTFKAGDYGRIYRNCISENHWENISPSAKPLSGEVMLPPEIVQLLMSRLLTALNGENIVQKRGVFQNSDFNTQVISPILSIIDDPFRPETPILDRVDAEGSMRKAKTLINSGILSESLNDITCAAILGKDGGNTFFDYMSEKVHISHSDITITSAKKIHFQEFSGDLIIKQLDPRQNQYNPKTGQISIRLIGTKRGSSLNEVYHYDGHILDIFREVQAVTTPFRAWSGYYMPGFILKL